MGATKTQTRAAAVLLAVAAALAAAAGARALNTRPVIGVLTIPCHDPVFCHSSSSYFPASYAKWLEGGGARVVPLHHELPAAALQELAGQLNGVLFTGGGASLEEGEPYIVAARALYDAVGALNAAGRYTPLWGSCMGFEAVLIAQARNSSVLMRDVFNSENLTLPLDFTPAAKGSELFSRDRLGSAEAARVLATRNVTMNNHHDGITPERFEATPLLADFFDVLSTNRDRNGTEFVSLIEGRDGYVFASQFHPEKPLYEWDAHEVIQHTPEAVFAMQYLAQSFVDTARRSNNSFPSQAALDAALIYNTPATFENNEFDQCYFWNFTAGAAQ